MIYPTDDDFVQICRIDESNKKCIRVLCKAITAEENEKLEDDRTILLTINNKNIFISPKECYCFGHINFEDIEDLELIKSFKWINISFPSSFIPRHYNYNTHTGDTVNGKPVFVETMDNVSALKYAHAKLGKPDYIAIIAYKTIFKFAPNKKYNE